MFKLLTNQKQPQKLLKYSFFETLPRFYNLLFIKKHVYVFSDKHYIYNKRFKTKVNYIYKS